jgi:hypothetical protein
VAGRVLAHDKIGGKSRLGCAKSKHAGNREREGKPFHRVSLSVVMHEQKHGLQRIEILGRANPDQ